MQISFAPYELISAKGQLNMMDVRRGLERQGVVKHDGKGIKRGYII